MVVYILNLISIILFGFLFIHVNPTENKKKIYCTICAVQWILISGLRDWTIGNDTLEYANAFTRGLDTSWETAFSNCWDYLFNGLKTKDPGYYLLQKIFQIFSENYQLWLFFIAIVFTGLMAMWIYKYSSLPDVSFVIYSVLFYSFYSITGHRQTLATALIIFLGYEYAKKKQFFKFVIVAFLAFMLHKSSIVFVLYYLIAGISITPLYLFVMSVIALVFALFGKQLYIPIATFLGFEDEQINYNVGGAETYATVLILLCLIAFCFYPWVKKQRKDAKYLYNMLMLALLTTIFVYQNQSFMRIQQYFSLVIMLIVPEIIQAIERKYRAIPYLFVVIFLSVYFINLQPEYKFFFIN